MMVLISSYGAYIDEDIYQVEFIDPKSVMGMKFKYSPDKSGNTIVIRAVVENSPSWGHVNVGDYMIDVNGINVKVRFYSYSCS